MRKLALWGMCSIALVFTACKSQMQQGSTAQTTQTPVNETPTPPAATTTSAETAAPTADGKHQPYVITDSSKIVKLEGGVRMFIVKEGSGPSPAPNQNVTINYEGRLTNGKVFDSSYERKQLADYNLGGLIRGWQVALPKMKMGSSAVLIIPADMGYGSQGTPTIPGNSTLIFDIDLITFY